MTCGRVTLVQLTLTLAVTLRCEGHVLPGDPWRTGDLDRLTGDGALSAVEAFADMLEGLEDSFGEHVHDEIKLFDEIERQIRREMEGVTAGGHPGGHDTHQGNTPGVAAGSDSAPRVATVTTVERHGHRTVRTNRTVVSEVKVKGQGRDKVKGLAIIEHKEVLDPDSLQVSPPDDAGDTPTSPPTTSPTSPTSPTTSTPSYTTQSHDHH